MSFFSKLFGKKDTKMEEKVRYNDAFFLNLIIIYKGHTDSDEQAEKYSALEAELWGYDCIATSGAMSSETAKQNGVPLPPYPDYPLIGIFELLVNEGEVEGYSNPLYLSSKKEEVKQFLDEYETIHQY